MGKVSKADVKSMAVLNKTPSVCIWEKSFCHPLVAVNKTQNVGTALLLQDVTPYPLKGLQVTNHMNGDRNADEVFLPVSP